MTIAITEQQDIVLKVIQDYLDNNRVFELDKIIPYIRNTLTRSSININDNGIKIIIRSLIENRYILHGSKLTKDRILKNENRKDIYYLIKNNPGIVFNQIMKELKLSTHVITWHIDVLTKFGCLNKARIDNHEIYFHVKVKKSNYTSLYLLSNKKIKNIISYIKNLDDVGINKSGASKDINIHYRIASKYIDSLEEAGILYKESLSNKNLYYLSDKYFKVLEKYYQ